MSRCSACGAQIGLERRCPDCGATATPIEQLSDGAGPRAVSRWLKAFDFIIALVALLFLASAYWGTPSTRAALALLIPFLLLCGIVSFFIHARGVWRNITRANGPHTKG